MAKVNVLNDLPKTIPFATASQGQIYDVVSVTLMSPNKTSQKPITRPPMWVCFLST